MTDLVARYLIAGLGSIGHRHQPWETLPVTPLTDRNQVYLDELSHFLDCIAQGTLPQVDGAAGLRALAIVAAARQSLNRSGLGLACRLTVGLNEM